MQTGEGLRQSFIVTRQSAESRHPAETSFDHPSSRQQHKASFRRWEFDDFELDTMFFCRIGCVFACVALINIGDLDCFAGLGLHSLGKFGDLGSILLISCCYAQRKKMSQGVNRQMDFVAFAAFRPIVAGSGATLDRQLQRPTIEDRSRRLFLSAFGDSQHFAQVVDERFKDFCFDPPLRLLINDMPGWQIVRHKAPRGTTTNYPAQAVEDLSQWKISLRSIFGH